MKTSIKKVRLENRGVFKVSGEDALMFLQGLITNDMNQVSSSQAIYGVFLTAQGFFSHDLFITRREDSYLIDTELDRLPDLLKKFRLYKLRIKVVIEDVSQKYSIWAAWGDGVYEHFDLMNPSPQASPSLGQSKLYEGALIYGDPRLVDMGVRAIVPHDTEKESPEWKIDSADTSSTQNYEHWRLSHGIPESSQDLIPNKSMPLECNLDLLKAFSWDKGCYLGQELTARTKYRGLVRKRLFPVRIQGSVNPNDPLLNQEGKKVGTLHSSQGSLGMAMIRLEAMSQGSTTFVTERSTATVTPFLLSWMTPLTHDHGNGRNSNQS